MKITAVKSFAVRAGQRNVFIVKVETDKGISGLGEGGMSGRELAMQGQVDHFARFLVGMDPRRIEHVWQTLYRGAYFEGGKIAGWCEAHYIDMMPHNPLGPVCTAASIHFCAAINNFAQLEYRHEIDHGYPRDLFPALPAVAGDSFDLPTAPGLGVSFDEEAATHYAFEYWEAPHLRRRDGAYTNW